MDFKNDKLKGVLWGVAIGLMAIVLVFRIPVFIDLHFRYLKLIDQYNTMYTASDILQYYGILLGAAAAIVAVLLTINYSKKSSYINKIETINTEYRKIGIDTCLKLLNIFDIQTFEKYEKAITGLNFKEQDLLNDLGQTASEMESLIKDFRRIYRDQKDEFQLFSNWYYHKMVNFVENHSNEAKKNNFIYDPRTLFNDARSLRSEHTKEYSNVKKLIIETMTTYNVKK